MIVCCLSLLAATRTVDFEPKPPLDEVTIGRKVYRSGAGIDRTLQSDKSVLGTWYDGRVKRGVDSAVWVSPELTARWLGYMAERDVWSDEKLLARWQKAQKELSGKLTFIVRLSAFPRLDPFEFGIGAPPQPETLKGAKLHLTYQTPLMHAEPGYIWGDGKQIANADTTPFFFEREKPEDVLGRPFYSFTKLDSLFEADGEVDPPDDAIPLGDFYGAVYVAQFPLGNAIKSAKEMELSVQLSSKREVAHYLLLLAANKAPNRHDDDD